MGMVRSGEIRWCEEGLKGEEMMMRDKDDGVVTWIMSSTSIHSGKPMRRQLLT